MKIETLKLKTCGDGERIVYIPIHSVNTIVIKNDDNSNVVALRIEYMDNSHNYVLNKEECEEDGLLIPSVYSQLKEYFDIE